MLQRSLAHLGILIGSVAAIGCSGEGLPTVPVSGLITFGGSAPPAKGSIAFSPISVEQGMPRRPGTAEFDVDGRFAATSFREGDGLLPGRYRAIVSCWTGEPSNSDPKSFERLNAVPKSYEPEEFTVKPNGEPVTLTINVPAKKN
jgi:hypothetical protein